MSDIEPGFLVLHGTRLELLKDAVFSWLESHPLGALEEEYFLVQSNGMAEWLKMALAARSGICAATRVELPARFLWRAYRQVLGGTAVPPSSPLDKLPLTWRLMQRLPELVARTPFEPLAGFLRDGDMTRRLQLAQRLADLFDQYQVYRSDWLAAWAAGYDVLPRFDGEPMAPGLNPDQRWQPALWRELIAPLSDELRAAMRPALHQRFVAALAAETLKPKARASLPRRVVLFGMAHLPTQTLQALAALSRHCQVLLAVPNPCRYHWADIIDGRELLRMQHRRQPLRKGRDLADVPLEDMHAHAHPLLAAWGRQGRDFVRQLDAFDDTAAASRQRLNLSRVDLFDDAPGESLLEQVQARIRDLVPLAEHAALSAGDVAASDRSIVFHIAHGAQREVEILHDQLLELLAHPPPGAPLNPRDVVVMVPDIQGFAPAIRSVFGQYARGDARFIPFDIADLQERGNNPLLSALEWLLSLPQQRCGASELRDLLDVPAVAERLGLDADELPRLASWIGGAGIRWGLDAAHRAGLGLDKCDDLNTWRFGVRRMLLGYAVGRGEAVQDIEPYAEVGGLEASIAGSLALLLDALQEWAAQASLLAPPAAWAERLRQLLARLFAPTNDVERLTLAALQDALRDWLEACDTAGFDEPVSLAVAREAWLSQVDAPGSRQRFRAGGVTFCTLLPMRAIPFDVVCLLGMNDGDYPRAGQRADFDLMSLPGQSRAGDRSRRDDDRQLMLEALLSARRVLYVSWAGRSLRDNSQQPPSVLVAQLRDYLAAGWGMQVLQQRTTEHPLQPFSRRYFETQGESGLFTHAREWRAAHELPASAATFAVAEAETLQSLNMASLARFLKNPVREFFRLRLQVHFVAIEEQALDEEAFALDGLARYKLLDDALTSLAPELADGVETQVLVAKHVARARRAGQLPMASVGRRSEEDLLETLVPMLQCWRALQTQFPQALTAQPMRFEHAGVSIDDVLDGLRCASEGAPVWLLLSPRKLCTDKHKPVADKFIDAWVRCLVASACGVSVPGVIVSADATLHIEAMPCDLAETTLRVLIEAWHEGVTAPLPLACKTAMALVGGSNDVAGVYDGGENRRGEVEEMSLSRLYPDFEALSADGRFAGLATSLYGPVQRWVNEHITVQAHAPR
jgi:exodeoxyribonuclease V gamma subunit